MEGLTEGRMVHYCLVNKSGDVVHRPAVVVRIWSQDTGGVNLQVFTDGGNDGETYQGGLYWATSVSFSEEPKAYTWHWIERA